MVQFLIITFMIMRKLMITFMIAYICNIKNYFINFKFIIKHFLIFEINCFVAPESQTKDSFYALYCI